MHEVNIKPLQQWKRKSDSEIVTVIETGVCIDNDSVWILDGFNKPSCIKNTELISLYNYVGVHPEEYKYEIEYFRSFNGIGSRIKEKSFDV